MACDSDGEDDMIIRLAEGPLHTLFGTFRELLYDRSNRTKVPEVS